MDLYQRMRDRFWHYNPTDDMLKAVYGLDSKLPYDAIIVAPSWTPEKVFKNYDPSITCFKPGHYYCGYEVNVAGKKLGYLRTASRSGNVIDACMLLGGALCDNILFIGAAGALVENIELGDIVTPRCAIAGDGGSLYLYDTLSTANFQKKLVPSEDSLTRLRNAASKLQIKVSERTLYCVDSIFCEYHHLADILSLGSEIIDNETAAFIRCMELIRKNYGILLSVSDNSACGHPLVGRREAPDQRFNQAREIQIPALILALS